MTDRERLTALASVQGGIVGRAQAQTLGIHRAVLARLCRLGFLVPDSAAYWLPSVPRTAEARLWRAVFASGGILSHATAARRLGLGADLASPASHVTVEHGRKVRRLDGLVVHRSRRLPPTHTTRDAAGLPHTIAPRTFVDLAAPSTGLTERQLVDCLDAWIGGGQVSLAWLNWFLDNESLWLPGRARALAVLRSLGASQVDSGAERQLARLLQAHGLQRFVTQHIITIGSRAVARVDFAWPGLKVALELDGYRFHSGPAVFVADRRRGNDIELAGWVLLRTTPVEVRDEPERLVATIKSVLSMRRNQAAAVAGAADQYR